MRILEIRRHSKRERPSKHLSHDGVALARDVGRTMGPFGLVVCSSAWRCVETAVAMGFAVNEVRDDLHMHQADDLPGEVFDLKTFGEFADAASAGKAKKLAEEVAEIWSEIARSLPSNGTGLVVGHGVMIELGAVAAMLDADPAAWGAALAVCDGVRLGFDRGRFVEGKVLRARGGRGVRETARARR